MGAYGEHFQRVAEETLWCAEEDCHKYFQPCHTTWN